jgi:hypothetical protein
MVEGRNEDKHFLNAADEDDEAGGTCMFDLPSMEVDG